MNKCASNIYLTHCIHLNLRIYCSIKGCYHCTVVLENFCHPAVRNFDFYLPPCLCFVKAHQDGTGNLYEGYFLAIVKIIHTYQQRQEVSVCFKIKCSFLNAASCISSISLSFKIMLLYLLLLHAKWLGKPPVFAPKMLSNLSLIISTAASTALEEEEKAEKTRNYSKTLIHTLQITVMECLQRTPDLRPHGKTSPPKLLQNRLCWNRNSGWQDKLL